MNRTFEFNLCAVLAHTLLLERKQAEPLGISWANNACCSDPTAQPLGDSTKDQMAALEQYLPGISAVINAQMSPSAQAQLKAAQETAPGFAQLDASIYDTTGRQLNKTGEEIAASNQMAKARSDANVLAGPGMDIVRSADAAQRLVDPEFYKMREATGRVGTGIINSFGNDPAMLSRSERAEVERGLAQENSARGTFGSPSQVDAVSNAMSFGNAANQRRTSAANTIGSLAPAMQATRSGVDVLQQATGRPGQINAGAGLMQNANQAPGAGAQQMGGSLMEQMTQKQMQGQDINTSRRNLWDRMIGPVCCFIFMEAYNGNLPWFVRVARDIHYEKEPALAIGYRRMAAWLVPAMRKSRCVRWFVNAFMVKPLTAHGGWLLGVNCYGWFATPVVKFWFSIWRR